VPWSLETQHIVHTLVSDEPLSNTQHDTRWHATN